MFKITDSSISNIQSSLSSTIQVDEDNDLDHKLFSMGIRYCVVYDSNMNLYCAGSPFSPHSYDENLNIIIFSKWYDDEDFFDYIINPTTVIDTSSILPNKMGYMLFNNDKNYFVYPYLTSTAIALYKKMNSFFPCMNPIQQGIFLCTSNNLGQTRTNYGYTAYNEYFNLFRYYEDIIGFAFEAHKE